MLLKKKDLNTLILGLLLILMCHVMYLINIVDGIWILLFILFFGLNYVRCFRVKINNSQYTSIIILGLIMVLLSAFMAHYNVGQPITLGIDGQKIFLIILLSYFSLRKLLSRKMIDLELFEKIIVAYISEPLYNYLQRTSSISRNKKINHDFIEAAKAQMEYLDQRYPKLKIISHTAYASANLTVYDFYLKNGVKCSKENIVDFKKAVRENRKYIDDADFMRRSKKIQGKDNECSRKIKMELKMLQYCYPIFRLTSLIWGYKKGI